MRNTIRQPTLPCAAEALLPHRPPMLLIDSLVERRGTTARATAVLDEKGICCSSDRGVLQEYFLEIMAQTMAAANGYDALLADSQPRNGFIVGIPSFRLVHPLGQGRAFEILVETTMDLGSMKVMTGEVHADNAIIARAEIQVWEQVGTEDSEE